MLGNGDLPNASNRTIATVLGVCAIAAVLLALVVAFAVSERMDRATKPAAHAPPIAAKPAPLPPAALAQAPDPNSRSAPARGDPVSFFSADDYPPDALRRSEQGRVVARLALDTTGKVTRCDVATTSGSTSLDAATCRIALTRVHYRPALDRDGRPIASGVSLPVRWVLPEEPPPPSPEGRSAPGWLSFMLAALAAVEAVTAYRGWLTGRIQVPRSSSIAVRENSPRLFGVYLGLHIVFAIALGGIAILSGLG